jgi:Rieske Fe-S protein
LFEHDLSEKQVSTFPDHALAVCPQHPDISFMKRFLFATVLVVAAMLNAETASAQIIPPNTSPFNQPQPPPLPAPKIQVPVVPKMDELPSRNYVPAQRPSFSDKVNTCLDEATAGGLRPGERDAYVRACANSR